MQCPIVRICPSLSDRRRMQTRTAYTSLELEAHRNQQAPKAATAAGLKLYFILISKFNNAVHHRFIVLSH